jgi:hypothetical protein
VLGVLSFKACDFFSPLSWPLVLSLPTPTWLLVAAVLAGLCACDHDKSGPPSIADKLGDPIGIEIQAHAAVPALSVAVAVTKGRDPTPFVGTLASGVFAAAAGCPDFVTAMNAGKTARIQLGARGNKLESLGAAPDEVGGACITAALGGKPVTMDRPDPLEVMLELRAGASDAAKKP